MAFTQDNFIEHTKYLETWKISLPLSTTHRTGPKHNTHRYALCKWNHT